MKRSVACAPVRGARRADATRRLKQRERRVMRMVGGIVYSGPPHTRRHMRHFRSFVFGLIAAAAVASLGLRPSAQTAAPATGHAKAVEKGSRDLASATPESVGISSDRLRRIDGAMKRLVDEKRVAGLVTLLERHGKIAHFNAVGQLDVRKPDPMQKDSIFRIYSMTKPVTGVAMMMLYEEGKWRLEDPVSRYIPEFGKLKVYVGKNDDGTPKLGDARRSMTMRGLVTSTAGLGCLL